MPSSDYLVSYGATGFFGLFTPVEAMAVRRHDRVVIRSHRGLELGTVLCPATLGHAESLNRRVIGKLLRKAGTDDEDRAAQLELDRIAAFEEARRLARELNLPWDILDVEAMLEPRALVVHFVGDACDPRPLVSALARRFDAHIELHENSFESEFEEVDPAGSCGNGQCGSCGGEGGGCGSCGTGGCGTCHDEKPPLVATQPGEWPGEFVPLRDKTLVHSGGTP